MNNESNSSPEYLLRVSLQDKVLEKWVEMVRSHVKRAKNLAIPVLIDTLPMFYKHLAALGSKAPAAYDRSTLALEHGGERARMTSIDVHGIAHEFQIFRNVLFSVWAKEDIVIGPDELSRINEAIDDAIRGSIFGFVTKESSYREEFFAALTHDLRTPLGTAAMAVDMIGKTESVEKIHGLALLVKKQHSLMNQMITDLLETMSVSTGREELPEMSEIELYGLTEEITHNARLTSGKEIHLKGQKVVGHWSRQSIRRAIENLLSNAIKYGDKNSPVTISIEQVDSRVALSVTNLGSPIPGEQIESLFQMFRRGGRDANGDTSSWGIGLAYVRSVAERHGGSIVVASNAVQTSFVLDIPLDPRPLLLQPKHGIDVKPKT
jgi:signal transduction histidine kinase